MCDHDDPRAIVQSAYDNISKWYLDWVGSHTSLREEYVSVLLKSSTAPSPAVLDLGCGPGVPILRMLLDHGANVIGNDISAQQLALARTKCPEAKLILGDMSTLRYNASTFDGVVCFYALFHLPREEQRALLGVHTWLRPGGLLIGNFAGIDEEAIHGEFLGHGMFWSSFGVEHYRKMLQDVGFEMVKAEVSTAGDEDDFDAGVEFLWVVARKKLAIDESDAVKAEA